MAPGRVANYYASGLDLVSREISRGHWKPDEFVWGESRRRCRESYSS